MDTIRLATQEEFEPIVPIADITNASSVITFGGKDFAVFRNCFELDPVIFDKETGDKRKLLFLMNLETALRLQGIKEIYFTIDAEDETWKNIAKHWGAIERNDKPQIRFKKVL